MFASLLNSASILGQIAQRTPEIAKTFQRFGLIPVDIRNADDGTLMLRGTLGSILAREVTELEPGKYMAVVGSKPLAVTVPISINSERRISNDQLADMAKRLSGFTERASSFLASQFAAAPASGIDAVDFAGASEPPPGLQAMGPSDLQTMRLGTTRAAAAPIPVRIEAYDGLDFNSTMLSALSPDSVTIKQQEDTALITAPERKRPTLIRILSPDQAPLNAMLPTGARFILKRRHSAGQSIQVWLDFDEPFADGLLSLGGAKDFSALHDAVSMASDQTRLLPYAGKHPGGAAMLGYMFLRAKATSVVEDALKAVKNRSEMEPDSTIMLAVCAARSRDDHMKESLDLCLQAAATGMPCFSFGLSYLIDYLRLFSQTEQMTGKSLPTDANIVATKALGRVAPFSLFADHTRPFTAYTGLTPQAPSSALLSSVQFSQASGTLVQLV